MKKRDDPGVKVIPMGYEPSYSQTQIHFLTKPPEWLPLLDRVRRPHVILDLGAGGGLNSMFLRRALREAFIVALDLSFIRCLNCRQATGVDVVCSDALGLPFPDDTFDLVLSTQVIEHVPDDRAFAREAGRVLKRGGTIIISSVLRRPYGWYFYRNRGQWVLDPTHLREYRSREEFLSLFGSGFRILESAVDAIRFSPAHFVYRLLIRAGLIRTPDPEIFSRSAIARFLEKWVFRVPGYRAITAVVLKAS
jgi:SAM-dependent methyltransferase